MKSCTVDKLEVGMIVSRDVITSKGQILLKQGIELDEYYIKIFEKYGIEYVVVEDNNKQVKHYSDEEITKIKYEIRQQKKQIFQNVDEDSFFTELLEAVTDIELEETLYG
ncbi:MAG: hypothetical protein PHY08_12865 [Candidatus Cloacimonetes bacterium]|jgi:hypothetical protein|nr:hypothetical protein [Candidatus Cloacimonadota bacterium]MDD4157450.1 hypothetical protein [Candidatus Cloacimonadota bacterium]